MDDFQKPWPTGITHLHVFSLDDTLDLNAFPRLRTLELNMIALSDLLQPSLPIPGTVQVIRINRLYDTISGASAISWPTGLKELQVRAIHFSGDIQPYELKQMCIDAGIQFTVILNSK
jgi:hypothetical protein